MAICGIVPHVIGFASVARHGLARVGYHPPFSASKSMLGAHSYDSPQNLDISPKIEAKNRCTASSCNARFDNSQFLGKATDKKTDALKT